MLREALTVWDRASGRLPTVKGLPPQIPPTPT
jgi:hypothetical protein